MLLFFVGGRILVNSRGRPNACVVHQITIKNNTVSPGSTSGHLCDKLTFTNSDNVNREIAFGPHEHHVSYDGVSERIIGKNQSFSITLNKVGKYQFHDHIHDSVLGYFNVYSN
jgi:plastocyanin